MSPAKDDHAETSASSPGPERRSDETSSISPPPMEQDERDAVANHLRGLLREERSSTEIAADPGRAMTSKEEQFIARTRAMFDEVHPPQGQPVAQSVHPIPPPNPPQAVATVVPLFRLRWAAAAAGILALAGSWLVLRKAPEAPAQEPSSSPVYLDAGQPDENHIQPLPETLDWTERAGGPGLFQLWVLPGSSEFDGYDDPSGDAIGSFELTETLWTCPATLRSELPSEVLIVIRGVGDAPGASPLLRRRYSVLP